MFLFNYKIGVLNVRRCKTKTKTKITTHSHTYSNINIVNDQILCFSHISIQFTGFFVC